jgi:signal recognition particle subunit SEC65
MSKLTQHVIDTVNRYTQLDHYGPHQFLFRHYDLSVRAWREGQITNRERALHEQHQTRIRMALEMLGFEPNDAGALANSATYNAYPKDWRQCVRDELKAEKLAQSNAATQANN